MEIITRTHNTDNFYKCNEEPGKRLSLETLITYIESQSNYDNTIKTKITLVDEPTKNILTKLQFQHSEKINHMPKKLNDFFSLNSDIYHKYLHSGVLEKIQNTSKTVNISLYSSVLSCLISTFSTLTYSDQISYIQQLQDKMKNDITLVYKKSVYSPFSLTKPDIIKSMNICEETDYYVIIKYLSCYFTINIFILNIEKDCLEFGNGDVFIPSKKNIFLIKYNNISYEPLFSEKTKVFTNKDLIIKKIIENPKFITSHKINNKESEYFEGTVDLEMYIGKIKSDKANSSMKLQQLKELAEEMNIEITKDNKAKTKTQLIIDINKA
jgi:hypothetical protein